MPPDAPSKMLFAVDIRSKMDPPCQWALQVCIYSVDHKLFNESRLFLSTLLHWFVDFILI